jgi:transposase
MANTTKNMQQIRHILQLRAQGVSIRKIGNTTGVSRPTIRIYLTRWEAMGLPWEQLSVLDDEALATILYQEVQTGVDRERLEDLQGRIPKMLQDLSKTGVTRQLLWQEYRLQRPEGYGYTQFCEYLGGAAHRGKAVMHFEHKAGERLMIDFAGKKLHYVDVHSGEQIAC